MSGASAAKARPTPLILALDTAGSACSVAVGTAPNNILGFDTRAMRHGHGEALLPMVEAVMRRAEVSATSIDMVAVSTGPGGFTGIRVGLAAAQGIATAAGARLVGISSLSAVAAALPPPQPGHVLAALDSRRAELYVQIFTSSGLPCAEPISLMPAHLADFVEGLVGASPLLIAGDAADRAAMALAGRENVEIINDSAPNAVGVIAAASLAWQRGEVLPARPLYLRPPDVTLPKALGAFSISGR